MGACERMTDARELMAMMTAHGIEIGRPFGGIPKLTALDVAGAMGMGHLRPEWAALLLVKYCGDEGMAHQLWAAWFVRVMAEKDAQGWQTKPGQVERLSLVMLDEAIGHNACKRCEGTGQILVGVLKVCPSCEGVGRRYLGERQIAKRIRISRHEYRVRWASRAQWCRAELLTWEAQGVDAIARALRH